MKNPLAGEVTLPVVGRVQRGIVIPIVGGAAAYVVWSYWRRSSSAAYAGEDTDQGEYEDQGLIPGVVGAVSETGEYGIPDDTGTSTEDRGFTGTTNSAWTSWVSDKLTAGGWESTSVLTALGRYLDHKALTTTQQSIVQAAIAVGGPPPVGSFTIIPGGDTKVTVKPTGLKVTATTVDSVTLTWSPVSGASGYRIYRSGAANNVGTSSGTTFTATGLPSGSSWTWQVAAESVGGEVGPKSSGVKGGTKDVTLKAPTNVKVTGVTKTTIGLSWSAVPGAEYYRVYANGAPRGASDGTSYTVTDLKPGTRYALTVRADTTHQKPGPPSSPKTATTKRK